MSKKHPKPDEKLFTLDDMDEATLAQFQLGYHQGMYACYKIIHDMTSRLKQSSSDVWAMYNNNLVTPDKKKVVDQMEFAIDLLETLEDMFQDYYDIKIDEVNSGKLEDFDDE